VTSKPVRSDARQSIEKVRDEIHIIEQTTSEFVT
jgi:hypothetical protein